MKTETLSFLKDGRTSILWKPENEIHAMVMIVHGMTEHIQRYQSLAEELTNRHILCAGFDLLGHGTSNTSLQCASFGEKGWDASISEIKNFAQKLKQNYPQVPLFVFGFSLGSFLVRDVMSHDDFNADGIILAGTGDQPSALVSVIQFLVKGQISKAGFNQTTALIQTLSFGTYNQKFKPNKTESDWLCADEKELSKYLEDPLCRKSISSGLFYQLLESMKRTGNGKHIQSSCRNIPVLLLSGEEDPVGNFKKGVTSYNQKLLKAGIPAKMHLFKGARHDLFHEIQSNAASNALHIMIEFIQKCSNN